MDKIRFLALGGLDENGKNMSIVEINDDIYVIDVGLKYPRTEHLGVEIVIPDMTYLKERKDRVKGLFLTHGHDDVMGALPYFVRDVGAPIFAAPLVCRMVEDVLKEHKLLKKAKIIRLKRNSRFKIGDRQCIAFGLTHSIPDTFGLAISTSEGYIVHSSEFILDFDVPTDSFMTDMSLISEIGRKGVFVLLAESVQASRAGFTSPSHRITAKTEEAFETASGRILATIYDQNVYRLMELILLARKYNRKVYIYGDKQKRLLEHLDALGYYKLPQDFIIEDEEFDNDRQDVLVIVSGIGPGVFATMSSIATGENAKIKIDKTDTVIVASPTVPGTEKISTEMVNELYKEEVRVLTLNAKEVLSMHASEEDLKMFISLLKPKYFVPIKGEYQDFVMNANVAVAMGIKATSIVILDNGQVAEFIDGRLKSTSETLTIEEVLIDGKANLDTSGFVLRDRQILATDGVITAGITLNHRNKQIIAGPDIQSRGVIYLKDADNVMKEVGSILETTIQTMVKEHKYDNLTARNDARDAISKFIYKQTGKRPMVLPVIIEVHLKKQDQDESKKTSAKKPKQKPKAEGVEKTKTPAKKSNSEAESKKVKPTPKKKISNQSDVKPKEVKKQEVGTADAPVQKKPRPRKPRPKKPAEPKPSAE